MIEELGRELSNNKRQRFKMSNRHNDLVELQEELEKRGVKGFVIGASPSRVTILARQQDLKSNRRNWNEQESAKIN